MQNPYTDRDVSANLELATEITYSYVLEYDGKFRFLLNCKASVLNGEELSTKRIRGILNCMRYDFEYFNEELIPRATSAPSGTSPRRLTLVRMATVIKKQFGRSTHQQASTVHIVHSDSHLEKNTNTGEIRPRIRWVCKSYWAMPRDLQYAIVLMDTEEDDTFLHDHCDFSWCKTCLRLS